MNERYKFTGEESRDVRSSGRGRILISNPRDGSTYSLTRQELDMALLFDGERTSGEVLDEFYKNHGIRVSEEQLEEFASKLIAADLLSAVQSFTSPLSAPPSLPRRLAQASRATPDRGRSAPREGSPQGDAVLLRRDGGEVLLDDMHSASIAQDVDSVRDEVEEAIYSNPDWVADVDPRSGPLPDEPEEAPSAPRKGPRILLPLPISLFLWLGQLFSLPTRSSFAFWLTCIGFAAAAYGVWLNRTDLVRDLFAMLIPLTLLHLLVIGMFTRNLLGQLTQAAVVKRNLNRTPRFGITVFAYVIPRFYADVGDQRMLRHNRHAKEMAAAPLAMSALLFICAAVGWMVLRGQGTFLPLLCVLVGLMSLVMFVFSVNPLAKGPGYQVLALKLGVPDLRERALEALFGIRRPEGPWNQGNDNLSPTALRLYGLLVVLYLVGVSFLILRFLGRILEGRFGGLGVIIFLLLIALMLVGPLRRARARAAKVKQSPYYKMARERKKKRRRGVRPWLVWLLVLAVLVGLGSLPYTYEPGGDFDILPNKRADIRALTAGDIREIFVEEGDHVEAGQVLVRIAGDEETTAVSVSDQKLVELRARLALLQQGATKEQVALANQRVQTALTRYNFSGARAKRLEELYTKSKVVSRQEYENALSAAEVDRNQLQEAREGLALLESEARPEEITAIEASIASEEAQREYHVNRLDYTEIKSPIAGRIVSGELKFGVGDYLQRGGQIALVEDTRRVLANIKLPESDVGEVKVGAEVRVKAWAYPNEEFIGQVRSIAPNAETGKQGKVVRVLTEIDNPDSMLKSEMTGFAKIRGDTMPAALAFTRMLMRFFRIELWSWLP